MCWHPKGAREKEKECLHPKGVMLSLTHSRRVILEYFLGVSYRRDRASTPKASCSQKHGTLRNITAPLALVEEASWRLGPQSPAALGCSFPCVRPLPELCLFISLCSTWWPRRKHFRDPGKRHDNLPGPPDAVNSACQRVKIACAYWIGRVKPPRATCHATD